MLPFHCRVAKTYTQTAGATCCLCCSLCWCFAFVQKRCTWVLAASSAAGGAEDWRLTDEAAAAAGPASAEAVRCKRPGGLALPPPCPFGCLLGSPVDGLTAARCDGAMPFTLGVSHLEAADRTTPAAPSTRSHITHNGCCHCGTAASVHGSSI